MIFPGQREQVTLSDWLENLQSRIQEEINQFIAVGRIPFSVERCWSAQELHHHSASFSEQGVHCDCRIRTSSYIFWDFAVTQWVAGACYGQKNQDFKCSIMTHCLKPHSRRKKRQRLTHCLVMTLQVILQSQSVARPPSHSCEIWALSDQTNLKRSSVQESALFSNTLKKAGTLYANVRKSWHPGSIESSKCPEHKSAGWHRHRGLNFL